MIGQATQTAEFAIYSQTQKVVTVRARIIRISGLGHEGSAGERGQALVVAVLAMFMVLVIASLVINSADWQAKRQQAQSAADAAALAASDCMSNSTCETSSTSYQTVATNIAKASDPSGTVSVATTASGSISVAVSNKGVSLFSKLTGVSAPTESSSATAAPNTATANGAAACPTALFGGSNCLAIFGGDTCAQAGWSVTLDLGSTDFKGTILSNGDLNVTLGQSWKSDSPIYYGSTVGGCSSSRSYSAGGGTVSYDGTNGTTSGAIDTPQELAASVTYPEYWGLPSNVSSATYSNMGTWSGYSSSSVNASTPSCTYTPTNLPTASGLTITRYNSTGIQISGSGTLPSGTYCASGTIYIACSANVTGRATLIANWIDIESSATVTLKPYNWNGSSNTNQLLMMQTGTSQLTLTNSNDTLTGTIFAPGSEIYLVYVGAVNGLLEGGQVWYCMGGTNTAGTFSGSGVPVTSILGTSSLTG